jgi:hypothetical protein
MDDNDAKLYSFVTLSPASPPWLDTIETNDSGWLTVEGDLFGGTTSWQWGVPNNSIATEAHSPTHAWGTNLGEDGIDSAETMLVSPAIYLTEGNTATLKFWQNYDFTPIGEYEIFELAQLHISTNGGNSWIALAEYSTEMDSSGGWIETKVDLTPYMNQVVRLAWYYVFFSLDAVQKPGWIIDDVSIDTSLVTTGNVQITNNLSQAGFDLTGPVNRSSEGWSLLLTNVPVGDYSITYSDVPYYITPTNQTLTLTTSNTIVFTGIYSIVDTNGNNISDEWERTFFGVAAAHHPGSLDSDMDGATDYEEFIAGTDPTNATSLTYLTLTPINKGASFRIQWPSVSGHSYQLLESSNILNWNILMNWRRASGDSMTQTIPFNSRTNLFLRLKIAP